MKAFAALFTEPNVEVNYPGYARQEIDFVDKLFLKPIGITFPGSTEGPVSGVFYVVIFSETGEILCNSLLSNELKQEKDKQLLVILFCNLPEEISAETKAVFHAWIKQELKAEDIEVKLYERVNDELHKFGVPVIPVRRSGTAKMEIPLSKIPSFKTFLNPEKAA